MITNCPGCGTHFKHEPPQVPVRARCGRCDTSFNLGRLRPYRLVSAAPLTADQAKRVARIVPIGWDDPNVAGKIAENLDHAGIRADEAPVPVVIPVRTAEDWGAEDDPLPQIPEMAMRSPMAVADAGSHPVLRERPSTGAPASTPSQRGDMVVTVALWTASGAIAGTGASWTLGGETVTGLAAGAILGAVAGWMWLRWKSPE